MHISGRIIVIIQASMLTLAHGAEVDLPSCVPTPAPLEAESSITIPKPAAGHDVVISEFCEYWRLRDGLQSDGVLKVTSTSAYKTTGARPSYTRSDVANLQCYRSDKGHLIISILDKNFNECDLNPTESVALKTAIRWVLKTASPIVVTAFSDKYNTKKTIEYTQDSPDLREWKDRIETLIQCPDTEYNEACNTLRSNIYETMLPASSAAQMLKKIIDSSASK